MKKSFLIGLLLASASNLALALGNPATVPSNYPSYIPTSTSNATITSATALPAIIGPFVLQGNTANARFGFSGTFSSLAVTAYVTSDSPSNANPTWYPASMAYNNGQITNTLTFSSSSTTILNVNVSGASQVYLKINSFTGTSATISYSAGLGHLNYAYMGTKMTYRAPIIGLQPAASATDIVTICGSSGKTVAVTGIVLNGQATASSNKFIQLVSRTTADTGGTSSTVTGVPSDSSDATPSATVTTYTANPTVTGTNTILSNVLSLPSSTAIGTPGIEWQFGAQTRSFEKEIILRGANQCLAVNGGGASFPAGTALYGSISWTEY